MWFRRKTKSDPLAISRELRARALTINAADIGVVPAGTLQHVWGVLMETCYPEAVASVIALADGTTSLYFSNGGGIIGAGEHESVRAASRALLLAAQAHREAFTQAFETPLPEPGRVRFYVRTFGATLTAEVAEEDLGHRRHPLSPVFHAGHAVITELRLVSEHRTSK